MGSSLSALYTFQVSTACPWAYTNSTLSASFHTLGVNYVGELPVSPNGNKWILTAVCLFSNYLRAIPVPDKTATTAANALFNDIFLILGLPSVLHSDRGGEWLDALLDRITQLLSIRQVFTSGFRPCLNGTTERTHRFLTAALGIYCKHQQEKWEEYLQSAIYAHNTSPISGTSNITPFFLVFGRESISLALPPTPLPPDHYAKHIISRMTDAHRQFSQIKADYISPESISLALPPTPLPPDHYAKHIISRMTDAHLQFSQIKADLRRQQRDIYNEKARIILIPDKKIVHIRNDSPSCTQGLATRFIRNFDGPYVVTGHPYGRTDLLTLRHIASCNDLSHPINIDKVVIIPEPEFNDL